MKERRIAVATWDELHGLHQDLFRKDETGRDARRHWIFRGEGGLDRSLGTTLERAILRLYPSARLRDAAVIERRLLSEFQRRAHHYLAALPAAEHTLEWMALLRHFGAPVRLLDWTYSIWVALAFALEIPDHADGYALWALDVDACREAANRSLGRNPAVKALIRRSDGDLFRQDGSAEAASRFNHFFRLSPPAGNGLPPLPPRPSPFVYPVAPFHVNERLTIQQGAFLCPGDVTIPFQENLAALKPPSGETCFYKIELRPDRAEVRTMLQELYRMNMDPTTLYPGLEGFARSLNTRLGLRWISE